jgi:hypothetical protein
MLKIALISQRVLENELYSNLGDKDGVVVDAQGCSFRGSAIAPLDHHAGT